MSIEVELVSVYEGKVVGHLGILLNPNPRRSMLELTPLRGHLTLGVKGVHDAHTVSPGVSRTDR